MFILVINNSQKFFSGGKMKVAILGTGIWVQFRICTKQMDACF